MRRLAAIVALAGCDRVLSLDPVTPLVTGTFVERYATNRPDFTPAIETYVPPSISASVRLDDGSTPTFSYAADGSFSFPLAHGGQRYRLAITTPDSSADYTSDLAQLQLVQSLGARPSVQRTPVTLATPLQFRLTGTIGASTGIWLASTGQWTFTPTTATSPTFDFDWRTAATYAPPLGLLDASDYSDKLYVTAMDGSPYYFVRQAFAIPIDLVDGTPTQITGALVDGTPLSCIEMTAQLAEQDARWAEVAPDSILTYAYTRADAIPAYELGPVGMLMVLETVAYPPLPPSMPTPLQFFMPFEGSVLVANAGLTRYRTIQLPGSAVPYNAPLTTQVFVPVATSEACATATIAADVVEIEGHPTVAGVPITADATSVPLPHDGALTIEWSPASPGTADVFNVTVFELKSVSGYTVPHLVDSTVTAARSAVLDASRLVSGHSYIVRIIAVLGLPGASGGDFTQIAYPWGSTTNWSRYFTVQ